MNILKKIFPKYETKKDLRKINNFLISMNSISHQPLIQYTNFDVKKFKGVYEYAFDRDDAPEDYLKEQIYHRLYKDILPCIEWETVEEPYNRNKYLIGTLRIVENKEKKNDTNREETELI